MKYLATQSALELRIWIPASQFPNMTKDIFLMAPTRLLP